jgi:hypothetical protein
MLKRTVVCLATLAFTAACGDEPLVPEAGGSRGVSDPSAAVAGSARDLDALQRIVTTFAESWTAGDAATYAGQYAGAEWVGPNGVVLTDPAAITATYGFIFSVLLPGTTRSSTIRRVSFLTGTVAVLDIDARLTGFAAPPPGTVPWQPGILRALERNVVVKRGGGWRITLHQQTFVAPGS